MLEFLKTHMGHMVELSFAGMPSLSGRVLGADSGAVVLETEQGEIAIRPDSIVMAKVVAEKAAFSNSAGTSPAPASSLVVPNLNQRSGAEANIL